MKEAPVAAIQPSDKQALVSYHKISKSYDARTFAIKDFDLDIRQGEFLTMLGPSGSGKTTLLMMLAGFEAPTGGQIVVRGRQIQNIPAHRRNIGMVFQNYALFPHLNVAENVAYPLKVRGVPRSEIGPKVQQALGSVHLSGYGERRTTQLSGGQQQRVALARALVFNPDLVLMDEPFGALDKMLREEMQYEIKKLHSKLGVTIVFVTHDQGEALVMSDRVAILNHGKLQQVAAPKRLYEDPANGFVATFIGENNKLPGTVKVLSERDCVIALASGVSIVCRRGDVDSVGQSAVAMVRPERVQVTEVSAASSGSANSVPATITDITYLGESFRLEMRLACGTAMLAKLPNTKRAEAFHPGQSVALSWETAEGTAFQHGDGA
jgi:putative spermidine/putrescine transport system ATP-binding protein